MQATTVPLRIVAHDATDVPIYATGAMAHLFHTTHEQHYIFHAITYAACLGKCHRVQWRIQDFPEEAPTSKGKGANLLFGKNYRNCMKIKRIGPRNWWGHASKFFLCRSATGV